MISHLAAEYAAVRLCVVSEECGVNQTRAAVLPDGGRCPGGYTAVMEGKRGIVILAICATLLTVAVVDNSRQDRFGMAAVYLFGCLGGIWGLIQAWRRTP
jgi:hypothetical protein